MAPKTYGWYNASLDKFLGHNRRPVNVDDGFIRFTLGPYDFAEFVKWVTCYESCTEDGFVLVEIQTALIIKTPGLLPVDDCNAVPTICKDLGLPGETIRHILNIPSRSKYQNSKFMVFSSQTGKSSAVKVLTNNGINFELVRGSLPEIIQKYAFICDDENAPALLLLSGVKSLAFHGSIAELNDLIDVCLTKFNTRLVAASDPSMKPKVIENEDSGYGDDDTYWG